MHLHFYIVSSSPVTVVYTMFTITIAAARRFYQSISEKSAQEEKETYEHKVQVQRRRNRIASVSCASFFAATHVFTWKLFIAEIGGQKGNTGEGRYT